jgi:MYXO-CTERM domain-containing protein
MSRSLVLLLCLAPLTAHAAKGGPDSYGYYYVDSGTSGGPTYDSSVISTTVASGTVLGNATTTGASGADDSNSTLSLPFTFKFYGTSYSTAYVCSNGFLSFASYTSLSNTTFSANSYAMIAPFWDDMDNNGADSWVYQYSSGTSPNRVQSVVWYNTEHYNDTSNYGEITFAAQLYENGNIRMLWDDVTFEGTGGSAFSAGLSATAGLDGGSTAGYYTQLSYSVSTYMSASKVVEFIHPNNMPVAEAGGGRSGYEGDTLTINAGSSTPTSGLTYSFDCETDGTYEVADSTTSTYSCTYDDDGSYTATVEVDYLTYTDTDTTSVVVRNVAPEAVSWFASTTGTSGYGATVDDIEFTDIDEGDPDAVSVACDFDDVAADTISVKIDWGDGSTDTTTNYTVESHTYDDEGTYTVTCIGSDEDGGRSTDLIASLGYSLTIDVDNVAPTLVSASATGAAEGVAATFSASATDPGADTLGYAWTFGDGSKGTGASDSHAYSDDGTYTWSLTVTDGDGGSVSTSGTVTITDSPPVVTALSLPTTKEGSAASLSASVTAWSGDTLTYAWNFGDGSTSTSKAPSHSWADNGSYSVTLVVTDDEGSTSSLTQTMTITNVNPVASFSASVADEGSVSTFYGSATDAGTADTFTYAWDFGDGSGDTGETAWHTYAGDGSYTVTLTVTDKDGGVDTEVQVVVVGNAAPVMSAVSGDATVEEGAAGTFTASATDAGGDALVYTWDFGDGSSDTGDTVSHTWVQDGAYTVKVVVDDGVDTDAGSYSVVVTNGDPEILSATGDDGAEGEALAFAGVGSDPGTDDVLTYAWDFGDGSKGSGSLTSHTYADNGSYTVTLTLSDDGGASVETSLVVSVTNVDPKVTSTADETAHEGTAYAYTAAASDAGTADTLTWSLTSAPAAASFDVATATTTWTPTYADSLTTNSFTIQVDDDDGGAGTQTWNVLVVSVDTDGDGMPDGFEDAYGFDKADPSDGTGDADADGVSNADEALAGTDPTVFDGPTVPSSALAAGVDLDVLTPSLALYNATSPRGLPLTYDYELYSNEVGTLLVTSSTGTIEDASGTTSWTVDVPLTDDKAYWWRARANDGFATSAWMALDPIFVNLENSVPSVPVPFSPIEDAAASVLYPILTWVNASDDEGFPFTYDVQVWSADAATLVAEAADVVDEDERDAYGEWVVSTALSDETFYLWTVRAVDTQGLASAWSEPASFQVSLSGRAPLDVHWITPRDGEQVSELGPLLQWTDSEDPEGYPVSYRVQADVSAAFDSPDALDEAVDEAELDMAAAGLELPGNTSLYLRVRAEDASGTPSAWEVIEVYSRGENDAPPAPELLSPIDGELSPPDTVLEFAHAVDPEGDAVRYRVVVSASFDLSNPVFEDNWTSAGESSMQGPVLPDLALGDWFWSAKTSDALGAESDWAEAASFTVVELDDAGSGDDTGSDGVADGPDACGCATTGAAWPAGLFLVGASLLARRRRPGA